MLMYNRLKEALDRPDLLQKEGCGAALDALLDVKITSGISDTDESAKQFREAVINKKDFWMPLLGITEEEKSKFTNSHQVLAAQGIAPRVQSKDNEREKEPEESKPVQEATFEEIQKLAAKKRLLLSLENLKEDELITLINAKESKKLSQVVEKNKTVFGKLAGFLQPDNDFLDDEEFKTALVGEALNAFLIKKAKSFTKGGEVDHFIYELKNNFKKQITELGVVDFNGEKVAKKVLIEAQKHSTELKIKAAPTTFLLTDAFDKLNDDGKFKELYQITSIDEKSLQDLKGQLGFRYLTAYFPTVPKAESKHLLAIASQNNIGVFKGTLNEKMIKISNFPQAITPNNLDALRRAAATRALQLQIAECTDMAALDALIKVEHGENIKDALASHASLGFSGEVSFRQAFTDSDETTINTIIASAHLRKQLLLQTQKNTAQLIELIKTPTNLVYRANFVDSSQAQPNRMTQAIDGFFSSEQGQQYAKEQALIALFHLQVKTVKLEDLNNIKEDLNALKALVAQPGMMSDDSAKDLIGQDPSTDLNKILFALVEAERMLKGAATADLSNEDQFKLLINCIKAPRIDNLLTEDKAKLQEALLTLLIKNYPVDANFAPINKLDALALAKNKEGFVQALEQLGIEKDTLNWLTNDNYKAVQDDAATKVIALKIAENSPFNSDAPHKAFTEFFNALPTDKKRELLENPNALALLMRAKSEADIRQVLGEFNAFNHQEAITSLKEENCRLATISRIANASIVDVLAHNGWSLEPKDVIKINDALLLQGIDYATFIKTHIIPYVEVKNNKDENSIYAAFGLGNQGNKVTDEDIISSIEDQNAHNKALAEEISKSPSEAEERAVFLLMGIPKNEKIESAGAVGHDYINDSEVHHLLKQFNDSKNYKDLIDRIEQLDVATKFRKDWKKHLQPEQVNDYFALRNKNALQSTAALQTLDRMEEELADLREIRKDLKRIHSGVRDHIQYIADSNALHWLHPGFQAAAKNKAQLTKKQYKELAETCDSVVQQLEIQLAIYQNQLEALSGGIQDDAKKKANAYKKKLEKEKIEIEKDLELYRNASYVLNGGAPDAEPDTLKKDGILKRLDSTFQSQYDVKFESETRVSVTYHPKSEKETLLKKQVDKIGNIPLQSTGIVVVDAASAKKPYAFYERTPEEKNQIAEYTLDLNNTKSGKGSFIVEYGSKHLKPQAEKKNITYTPVMEATICRFPTDKNARIAFSMQMAKEVLANMASPPTAAKPLRIPGDDPVQVKHLWMALIVLGRQNPHFEFDEKAIKASPVFDPNEELGTLYGFKSGGLYDDFMQNDYVKTTIRDLRSFKKDQNAKTDFKYAYRALVTAHQAFTKTGDKGDSLKTKIEESNKRHIKS